MTVSGVTPASPLRAGKYLISGIVVAVWLIGHVSRSYRAFKWAGLIVFTSEWAYHLLRIAAN